MFFLLCACLAQGAQCCISLLLLSRARPMFREDKLQTYRNNSKTLASLVQECGLLSSGLVLCVLDFYVHESCQRQGVGTGLFEHMLAAESVEAGNLAYDRPSRKLVEFLRKKYSLTQAVPQTNNFVVYTQFFRPGPLLPNA